MRYEMFLILNTKKVHYKPGLEINLKSTIPIPSQIIIYIRSQMSKVLSQNGNIAYKVLFHGGLQPVPITSRQWISIVPR